MTSETQTQQSNYITTSDVLKKPRFRDRALGFLNDLDSENADHQALERGIRLLLELVEESRTGRYELLPIGLFARAVVELEQFVIYHDPAFPSGEDSYEDMLGRITTLCDAYREVIDEFQEWSEKQPEFDARRITQKISLPTDTWYP
ncbi:MAG: hypothetical protein R3242_10775 [Akkermansiaceae bacterium]|nr:hypothetical protein [Akkermansiaceae bacterium]